MTQTNKKPPAENRNSSAQHTRLTREEFAQEYRALKTKVDHWRHEINARKQRLEQRRASA